jgi:acyl-homoserine lactone acylase PvdQ
MGKRYALRWTALDPTKNKPDSTFQLNRARNWKEFSKALEAFTAPTQNIVYADVDGHIGYHAAGMVPVRKSGDGSLPYDGSTKLVIGLVTFQSKSYPRFTIRSRESLSQQINEL